MSLDAFNYTKDALLYAFCYGVYVKNYFYKVNFSLVLLT